MPRYFLTEELFCTGCGGTGTVYAPRTQPCPACDGTGTRHHRVTLDEALEDLHAKVRELEERLDNLERQARELPY